MHIANLNLQDQLTRYGKNTSEGVIANLFTQVLIYTAGAAPAVLPAFFNPQNIFSVLLAAAVLTGIQFVLQYPAVGGIKPEDSLREEISRLRELIQLLISARIVVRTDGGTQELPRLPLPRYSLILLGSALIIPLSTLSASVIDSLFIIVAVGAVSSNLGDAIGMAAYQRAVRRYGSDDPSESAELSSDDLEMEFEDDEITSNQEEILGDLSDIREWLKELFEGSERGPFVVTSERTESADVFAERVSSYVSEATYEQFQSSRSEIFEEMGKVEDDISELGTELGELAEEISYRLDRIEDRQSSVDHVRSQLEEMNDRVDSIETSLSSQRLDLDDFRQYEVREAFEEGRWSIVPGIGSNKERTLREELPSIESLQQASLGELEQIDGVGPVIAYRLKRLEEFATEGR